MDTNKANAIELVKLDVRKLDKKAQATISVLWQTVITVVLVPVIVTFIATAENLTATEQVLLGLIPLGLIIALVARVFPKKGM